jgi:hypothetical protein
MVWEGMNWINLTLDRNILWAVVNLAMNFCIA